MLLESYGCMVEFWRVGILDNLQAQSLAASPPATASAGGLMYPESTVYLQAPSISKEFIYDMSEIPQRYSKSSIFFIDRGTILFRVRNTRYSVEEMRRLDESDSEEERRQESPGHARSGRETSGRSLNGHRLRYSGRERGEGL